MAHSKFKNTGILFELLVRQIASDTLSGKDCNAIKILEANFKKGTELNKELYLYNTLLNHKYDSKEKAETLIEAVIDSRKKLNQSDLRRQKYNLVKTIKDTYVLEDFVKSKINNYREFAAIYQLFESAIGNVPPTTIVDSKYTLVEHITAKKLSEKVIPQKTIQPNILNEYQKLSKDDRLLSYKMLIDSFNNKYKNLNSKQKDLLREYINNISETVKLKEYIVKEIPNIRKEIAISSKSISDKVVRIKLKEIVNQLNIIKESKGNIKDTHIVALMKYYELIDELKKAISTNKPQE